MVAADRNRRRRAKIRRANGRKNRTPAGVARAKRRAGRAPKRKPVEVVEMTPERIDALIEQTAAVKHSVQVAFNETNPEHVASLQAQMEAGALVPDLT